MALSVAQKSGLRCSSRQGLKSALPLPSSRVLRLACNASTKANNVTPLNGDPYIGGLETPVTSAPIVASFLSNLPAYRTGVAPVLRGVEIGLAHGYWVTGPFIKLGPLRNVEGVAEISGHLAAAGLILILALALSVYGSAQFQSTPKIGVKTLSGRSVARDPLQTADGWAEFAAGFTVGGLSGVGWSYIMSQVLPYYS